jgi:NAD-dependent SIR2 family protein deacetylase
MSQWAAGKWLLLLMRNTKTHRQLLRLKPVDAPLPAGQSGGKQTKSLRTLLLQTAPSKVAPESLPEEQLAILNKLMTVRRIAARTAVGNRFHDFIGRLWDEGRLVSCLTTAFDGLEAKGRLGEEDKLVMLYGDNRILRCSMPNCHNTPEDDTIAFDQDLLEGRRLLCLDCCRACKSLLGSKLSVLLMNPSIRV